MDWRQPFSSAWPHQAPTNEVIFCRISRLDKMCVELSEWSKSYKSVICRLHILHGKPTGPRVVTFRSVHHFASDQNIQTTGGISRVFSTGIHGPYRMNPEDFHNPLIFTLLPQGASNFQLFEHSKVWILLILLIPDSSSGDFMRSEVSLILWNISTSTYCICIFTDIHISQKMYPDDLSDPLSSGTATRLRRFNNYCPI